MIIIIPVEAVFCTAMFTAGVSLRENKVCLKNITRFFWLYSEKTTLYPI